MKTVFVLAVALFWTALAPAASAQDQQSFKTIIGKGYEIKSVTFARGDATENREIFVVTLQREKSVAVCYFAALNWINLSPVCVLHVLDCVDGDDHDAVSERFGELGAKLPWYFVCSLRHHLVSRRRILVCCCRPVMGQRLSMRGRAEMAVGGEHE